MKLPTSLYCLLAFGADAVLGWNHASEASFRKALRSNDYTLVAFVDPSQEASKALEPEWTRIQETERDNNVVSFDCGAKRKSCDELDVASYPAIRLYHQDGRMDRYRGPRKASAIVPFLRRALHPPVSRLDEKNITSFVTIDDVVVIAHLQPEDSSLEKRFSALAGQLRDRHSFAIGPAADSGVLSTVSCYNNREGEQRSHDDFDAPGSLELFVDLCSAPIIVEMTRRSEMVLMNSGKSLVNYFVSTDDDKEAYIKEMRPLAKKYRDYLQFTTIDVNEYPELAPSFGLAVGTEKGLSVMKPGSGEVYPYAGGSKLTAGIVEAFLMGIINGQVAPLGKETETGGGRPSSNGGQGRAAGSGKAAAGRDKHEEL